MTGAAFVAACDAAVKRLEEREHHQGRQDEGGADTLLRRFRIQAHREGQKTSCRLPSKGEGGEVNFPVRIVNVRAKPSNVVAFPSAELHPLQVIQSAIEAKLEIALVLGVTKDGTEFFAASSPDGGDALWLMQRAIHKLMEAAK